MKDPESDIEARLRADAAMFQAETAELDVDGFTQRTLERLGIFPADDPPEISLGQ
jgi:hypothetical protein